MFQSTECFHMYHIPCLQEWANKHMCEVNKNSVHFEFMEPHCPKCHKQVGEWELKEIIKPEDWNDISERRLDISTANDPKLIKCQCGNIMEMNPGRVDYNQKDEKG